MASREQFIDCRILFVDDQPDVARTLAGLLKPLGAEICFASDGVSALARLRSEIIDLAIIDMKMPPGEWGGLWLLQQLGDSPPRVPVVALSGEGREAQIIAAHRVGACDWVNKDNAIEELYDRVLNALRGTDKKASTSGLGRLPTPIAVSLERVGSASMPNVELRLAHQAVEMYLRYTAIVGLSEAAFLGLRGPLRGVPGGKLALPSMGIWNTAVSALGKLLPPDSAFAELAECVDDSLIGPVVKARNDIGHGVEPSERIARELLTPARTLLTRLTTRAVARVAHEPVLPTALELHADGWLVSGLRLCGTGLATQRQTWRVKEAIPTMIPHMVSSAGGAFPLSPWLKAREARAHGRWDILLYESVKARNIRALVGTDRLLYTDVGNGEGHIQLPDSPSVSSVESWFGAGGA